ncbi:type VII secretion protein EccC [Prauserella marina]|uniref:DNA segregation ATPase FtsK/SpoIIIE, S-DNA-T family n=1 Tax=Prauserella marina TaxID=530584 RepID=A0A222VJ75_9PSEU|nr:type VII secretion protein EccCa [Prauserella marina]ASR33813.1 type VII secretion protein EccC [Prauserella marina]PWV82394.1 S-DNA-T family DNA segregation ATPase FtsK/SpoIIIE [Prauserella marina]SDC68129.1 DNA segregation ATPase FtsK/SpoIIIE, S-DNA-T family [Prauserella marina]
MGTIIVKRPLRRPAPDLPSGEVVLESPPENPGPGQKNWTRTLMILPMLAGTAGMALMMTAGRSGPLMYVAGGLYGFAILGMILFQIMSQAGGGPSKQEMLENRRKYMRRLSKLRAQVRDTIERQRLAMFYRHPNPDQLWSTAHSARLWERRPDDWDFTILRIGVGSQELATPLVPPDTKPVDELEPLCAMALRKFVTTYSTVPDLPVAVALRGFSRIYVTGDQERKRAFARALMAQLATFHAPGDVVAAFCINPDDREKWEWAKWIPHALHPSKQDAIGPIRLVAPSISSVEAMLDDVLANRPRFSPGAITGDGNTHVVVFLDGGETAGSEHLMIDGGVEGVTLVSLSAPPPRILDATTLVLDIDAEGAMNSRTMDGEGTIGKADALDIPGIYGLARSLAPMRLSALSTSEQPLANSLELTDLLGLGDPYEFDLSEAWATRSNRDRLRVPIGLNSDGRLMELDLKESAQDGMGPHGLLVGATGSGKSELLRTLVLALAVTHDSEILNFVLVDFKGGATFTKLDRLAHTSAVITNLSDELHLVDRMLDAIQGELLRRQELLRSAGNYGSQRDYEKARAAGAPLDPLPALLVIVDEFSELLTARPDFIDMFVQIGRVGRSLGVHLLLASQRLEEGKLRGLDSHLSYRIGLRTFSAMESRAAIGSPDAFQLPRSPGNGFLRSGTDDLLRFRAAYVSGVHRKGGAPVRTDNQGRQLDPVQDYSTRYARPRIAEEPVAEAKPDESEEVGETLLDVLVERLEGRGRPAHQVWLPPLDEPSTLDQLLGPLVATRDRGLTTENTELHGNLRAAAGIIDRPAEQRRDVCWLDLEGSGGHVLVIGGPHSGKSTALRSIMGSLALTHTPEEVQFVCLDFGGGGMAAMRNLAHVSSIAGRRQVNEVRRSIAEAYTLMMQREQRFTEYGIDSMATYRKQRKAGRHKDDPFGDLFIVIDGWATLRSEFEKVEPTINELVNRGLGFGIHILAAANRWMDLRMNVRDMFGSRVEMRLGDPIDSSFGRRQAASVPANSPGRGLSPDGGQLLAAVPRIDNTSSDTDLADAIGAFADAINGTWTGRTAPRVRLLPAELPFSQLPPASEGPGIPVGISEHDLGPAYLNFEAEPHLLLFGDVECGKSNFLRALATGIMNRYSPEGAQIAVIDYRRSLLGLIPDEYLIGYSTTNKMVKEMVDVTIGAMQKRLPGGNITPDQLKKRSWWKGPELFLLVDDFDLVAPSSHDNPLRPLLDYLTQGRDIGLHLVLTRRSGGAGRAMFDPVVSRIRDLASPGIMMSGKREEGPLIGNRRPEELPPGRGWLITRGEGERLVQFAHLPQED